MAVSCRHCCCQHWGLGSNGSKLYLLVKNTNKGGAANIASLVRNGWKLYLLVKNTNKGGCQFLMISTSIRSLAAAFS
ncbi:hypothetical protein SAMN04488109_1336 [Chryseolinea serpens]|uniref:Uncharacterized protein n=1 Tax=Chryseolinea serpens TaxID=947013 RepID=A0A1M5LR93_9BACT|nr:hypothetical protein SAMN04488109_1336 [Chryseolinea serpens]